MQMFYICKIFINNDNFNVFYIFFFLFNDFNELMIEFFHKLRN